MMEQENVELSTAKEGPSSPDLSKESVNDEVLQLWLRRCRRKYLQGVTVIKVCSNGKLVKRQLYIGAKPEYLELISSKLFDTAYHLSTLETVECTLESTDFDAFRLLQPGCMPKKDKSLVIRINDNTAMGTRAEMSPNAHGTAGGRIVSLVFQTVEDRRDAQIYLRAQITTLRSVGQNALRDYERVKTLPTMKCIKQLDFVSVNEEEDDDQSAAAGGPDAAAAVPKTEADKSPCD
ncbi:hypothetical protein GNI_003320 [Gregarina niphandrodes]|uniref:Uncharacterized protein n=1 Tax=Gregarina niphandrodes TaxID=110365 RepID=A0A023BDK0_GRENI|nr:hypothetical protein GNI_003320 [Gregarina niphandrodes]EZG89039.1 hypothetical protein GNI_003320 [Gregarina niphandrodes]|eukprot:XP_011128508.1 hypothetical protein GNI_003320 [Gregarina niphandrodes]